MGLELMCCSGDGTAVYMSFEEDEIGIPMSPIEQVSFISFPDPVIFQLLIYFCLITILLSIDAPAK